MRNRSNSLIPKSQLLHLLYKTWWILRSRVIFDCVGGLGCRWVEKRERGVEQRRERVERPLRGESED